MRARQDTWLGLGLLLLAALGWFVAIPAGIDLPRNIKIAALSPDFWPRIVMLILALSGASIAVQGLLARGSAERADENVEDDGTLAHPLRSWLPRVTLAFALLFGYYFSISHIGLVAASSIILFVLAVLLGQRAWWRVGALALLMPVALYLFFAHVAQVPMPLGIFEALR